MEPTSRQPKFSSGFRRKLFISILRIAAPVIAAISIAAALMLAISARQTALNSQAAAAEKVRSSLSYIVDSTQTLSQDMIFNNEIQELLQSSIEGEQFPQYTDAAYHINGFIANRDYVNCVVITGSNQTLYSTEKAFTDVSDYNRILHSVWFDTLQSGSDPFLWFVNPKFTGEDAENDSSQIQSLMLARPVYSLKDYTTRLGYLMIYLDDSYIRELLDDFDFGATTNLLLLDASGEVILKNETSRDYSALLEQIPVAEGKMLLSDSSQRYLINIRPVTGSDWSVCMITPLREVNITMYIFLTETVLLAAATIFTLFFLASRTASSLARPLVRLADIMDTYRNEGVEAAVLPEHEYQGQPDEISRIYQSYRQMADRIDRLIRDNFLKNLEKKDAELALLQSQINPHFLYNTLDSINWMAIANDEDEISEMVTALSDMFRLSLTRSRSSYILLSAEIDYVRSYLTLEQFRYQDCLRVSVDMDPLLGELLIPRFTLQPLAENAIKHGLVSPDEPFRVDIRVFLTDEALHILIGNDGSRIDLDKMRPLLDFDVEKQEILDFDLNSYGVQNIHRRIRILCGAPYGLSYFVENGRTYCDVLLPVRKTENPENPDAC